MGASIPRDSLSQSMSGSFYGNESPLRLAAQGEGRPTMPGGPLLPRLPRNPFATTARKMAKLSTPYQPKNFNARF